MTSRPVPVAASPPSPSLHLPVALPVANRGYVRHAPGARPNERLVGMDGTQVRAWLRLAGALRRLGCYAMAVEESTGDRRSAGPTAMADDLARHTEGLASEAGLLDEFDDVQR